MDTLNVLVLNASLKHGPAPSNTEEVAQLVLSEMAKHATIASEVVRLADKEIPVGLGFKESETDEWPVIVGKIKQADIVIFATPVWWGQRSSLMQRVIERMDAFDEEAHTPGGRAVLLNKVAGIVVTGSEDGAQQVIASIMEVLMFMNFTLPPQCATYWVGEVGKPVNTEAERRRGSEAVPHMAAATAKNLVQMALSLKANPFQA